MRRASIFVFGFAFHLTACFVATAQHEASHAKAEASAKRSEPPRAEKVAEAPPPPASHGGGEHGAPAGDAKAEKVAPVSAEAVWRELEDGNARFLSGKTLPRDVVRLRKTLAAGQHPRVAILTCSDSRVPPELLFDQGLGDVFVVRSAGATADPVALGSLEYAVEHLHVGAILVLGHEKCGAVAAAVAGGAMPSPNLEAVVRNLKPALAHLPKAVLEDASSAARVGATVDLTSTNLVKRSPILREAVDEGRLAILRAVYSLDTGAVARRTSAIAAPQDGLWSDLVAGNRRFIDGAPGARDVAALRKRLATGQEPHVIVLTCADSRVVPEAIFDQSLGDLFVVRNAGNLPDALALGSIEYAVEHLHAELIVVMGHEKCGAVAAAASGAAMPTKNLQAVVDEIAPGLAALKDKTGGDPAVVGPAQNASRVARLLVERSSIVREAVESGDVGVVSCFYELDSGRVTRLDAAEAAGESEHGVKAARTERAEKPVPAERAAEAGHK